ncbi:MAG: PilZ domain-containing protein [Treponema sp.]|nr:PilZ domain-containing protein [Candidatus Treponema caballi]
MSLEHRKDERFEDIGRVDAQNLCVFPGVLVDISMLGCRIRFPAAFDVDMESDFELKITPARKYSLQNILLIGHPQWVKHEGESTEVGFKLLRSPGTRMLGTYVQKLALAEAEFEEEEEMLAQCAIV